MYKVSTGNIGQFYKFLRSTSSAWVNFIINGDGALLVQNTSEIFAALQLKSERSPNQKDQIFRIKSELLRLLLVEGYIAIEIERDTVTLDFLNLNGAFKNSVSIPKHQAYVSTFREKLSMLNEAGKQFKAEDLKKIIEVAKAVHSFVEVGRGVAGVIGRSGIMVCQKVSNMPDFSITANAADTLFGCSGEWMCFKNFICAVNGSYGVIVTQCRGNGTEEFEEVLETKEGVAMIAKVELEDLTGVFGKVRNGEVILNLQKGLGTILNGDTSYKIKVPVTDLKVSPKYQKDSVQLNTGLLLDVFPKLKSYKMELRVRRNYNSYVCGNFIIVSK